ncbi:sulfite exporter TauE/SafE family protein [Streptococcus hongkongensis]|nr:hypothetical protein NC01_02275 [Streptococcus uberis]
MILFLTIIMAALLAGFIQGVTGFGAGIVLMSVLPYLLLLPKAAALTNAVAVSLTIIMVYHYRKYIRFKLIVWPTLFYIVGSSLAIHLSKSLDINFLKIIFAIFLIALVFYFSTFSQKITISANFLSMFLCGFVSGICDGLFAIGGPLMVLFFLAVTENQRDYLANLQVVFLISGSYNLIFRAAQGILTLDLLLLSLVGIAAIIIGLLIANRIVDRLDAKMLQQMTYLLIAVSGAITLITTLF